MQYEPITASIRETARILGVSRSTVYRLLAENALEAISIKRRRLVLISSIRKLGGGDQ